MRSLAELADVSTNTIVRYEGGAELRGRTIRAIQTVLEAAGASFLEDDDAGTGPGVRLRPRAQASSELIQAGD